jgi:hypothetical protein
MGTASRKTWLEKQTEDIRKEVLAMDEGAMTMEEMCKALKDLFGISVPVSTLGNALKIHHDSQDLRWAAEWGADLEKLIEENPHIQAAKLAKGFLTQKMASASFRGEPMKAADVVAFSQAERRMDLDERKTKAIEERNRLKGEQIALEARRVEVLEGKLKDSQAAVKSAIEKTQEIEPKAKDELFKHIDEIYGVYQEADPASLPSDLRG